MGGFQVTLRVKLDIPLENSTVLTKLQASPSGLFGKRAIRLGMSTTLEKIGITVASELSLIVLYCRARLSLIVSVPLALQVIQRLSIYFVNIIHPPDDMARVYNLLNLQRY